MSSTPSDGDSDPYAPQSTGASGDTGRAMASAAPPAGWYPMPSGDQQFWDGEKWLEFTPPFTPVGTSTGLSTPGPAAKKRRIVKGLLIAGVSVLLLGLIGGGIAWKNAHDSNIAAAAAASAAQEAAAKSSEQRQRDEADAAAAKARQDDAERASRRDSVTGIEATVKKMAEKHASTGLIRGPIISVTCSPVGGGSTDDLTEQTTVFSCFVANKDNGDGTMSGYPYKATMNWSTGSYTYGFGAP
jgi:Protein of unknown function (DUF2510)